MIFVKWRSYIGHAQQAVQTLVKAKFKAQFLKFQPTVPTSGLVSLTTYRGILLIQTSGQLAGWLASSSSNNKSHDFRTMNVHKRLKLIARNEKLNCFTYTIMYSPQFYSIIELHTLTWNQKINLNLSYSLRNLQ